MASAPLIDEARFVREMQEAYRAMWRRERDLAGIRLYHRGGQAARASELRPVGAGDQSRAG